MTQRTVSAGSGSLPLLLVVGITVVMLAVRLAETQGDPLVYLRVLCSLVALAIVIAGRRNLLRCALFAFALEAGAGIVTFVYVDIPFVNAHHAQIGALAVAIHDRIEGNGRDATLSGAGVPGLSFQRASGANVGTKQRQSR